MGVDGDHQVPSALPSHGRGQGFKSPHLHAVPVRRTYGWDGGLGTSWYPDPSEDMVTILMTQRAWTSPNPPEVCLDFWTAAYAAIDD